MKPIKASINISIVYGNHEIINATTVNPNVLAAFLSLFWPLWICNSLILLCYQYFLFLELIV